MTDVLQSHSSRSVPVGFYLPPLHPCLMDLSLLLIRPIQYTLAQLGSLFRARDVEGWQLPIDWRVSCALLAWFFTSHLQFQLLISIPSLPAFVGVVIITIAVTTSLLAPGTACTTCIWAAALMCTAPAASTSTAAGGWLLSRLAPPRSLLHHPRSSWLPWLLLPAQCLPLQRYLRPCRFWALGPAVRVSSGSW